MSLLAANLVCIVLVVVDLVARTWRIQWILWGMRFRVPFGEALAFNAVGDAAAAVTPLRAGGEPVRLAAMTHARVPLLAGFVSLLIEVVVMWPVIFAAAGWLALIYAPTWWHDASPRFARAAHGAGLWLAVAVGASFLAWWVGRRFFPRTSHAVKRSTRRALAYGRRMPAWPLVASIPLTLLSLAARVAILPILALTLATPPDLGPLSFASFTLVYGQLLLPMPSGAGVVEFGFLRGAVGDLGGQHISILLIWRLYTTIVPVALGLVLGFRQYGREAAMAILRGRSAAARPAPERD